MYVLIVPELRGHPDIFPIQPRLLQPFCNTFPNFFLVSVRRGAVNLPVPSLKCKSDCSRRVISRFFQVPGTETNKWLRDAVVDVDWLLLVATLNDANNGKKQERCFHNFTSL